MIRQVLNQPFFISLFGGILAWLFIFGITPAEVTYSLAYETIGFVTLSYFFLILGYSIVPKFHANKSSVISKKLILYSIVFVFVCFLIRFIDIFYFRGLRFLNSIYSNRMLATHGKQNLIFIGASVFKSLYFVPLLLLLLSKIKSKKLLLASGLLFVLPLFEAVLRGSRSVFLISFLFFILILIVTKSITFSKKNIFIFGFSLLALFIISTQILMNREGPKNKNPYGYLVEKAIYNDFFKPKQYIIDYMNNPTVSSSKKKLSLSALQIGQYYTHGLFEFDYLVKHYQEKPFQMQYGKYSFYVFPKLTNHFNITHYNLDKIHLASPRGYTFISFFGGMYIDFGWFALIIMFVLGAVQKIIYNKVQQAQYYYAPLLIFLLFINFFMLTFNFFKGTGTYTLISCIIFAALSSNYFQIDKK